MFEYDHQHEWVKYSHSFREGMGTLNEWGIVVTLGGLKDAVHERIVGLNI